MTGVAVGLDGEAVDENDVVVGRDVAAEAGGDLLRWSVANAVAGLDGEVYGVVEVDPAGDVVAELFETWAE